MKSCPGDPESILDMSRDFKITPLGALLPAEGAGVRSTLFTRALDHQKSPKVINNKCSWTKNQDMHGDLQKRQTTWDIILDTTRHHKTWFQAVKKSMISKMLSKSWRILGICPRIQNLGWTPWNLRRKSSSCESRILHLDEIWSFEI